MGRKMKTDGLLHLYIGDGKGKTTAAIGMAVRMAGCGKKVFFSQFLKGRPTGELASFETMGITLRRTADVKKFLPDMNEQEREQCAAQCRDCFAAAWEAMASGKYALVVLDEVLDAVNCGMIARDALAAALRGRHPETEVVLTGRNPGEELMELADYVSEIVCRKHPYQRGIPARRGIEY